MKLKLVLLFCLMSLIGFGQITFQKTYGGINTDYCNSVQQTADGGYIIAGFTSSFGAGYANVYLIKTDSTGDTLWTKTYGGINNDQGWYVQQTTDGGYIITGNTNSFGAGDWDVYLIKTNSLGDTLWTKTYGDSNPDFGYSVRQTADGGYIIAGTTYSLVAGDADVYLIKTNSIGDTLWTKTYGGSNPDNGYAVQQTADGGYIIVGQTGSFGAGGYDVYLIRTDSVGVPLWTKTLGGVSNDEGNSIQQTADGGYIIGGWTESFGAGIADIYLIKTDTSGNIQWSKTFGGTDDDRGWYSVQQTSDGGYIMEGWTFSFGAGAYDAYLIKTDATGDTLWTKTFGGTGDDYGYSVKQTADGGYIIGGTTSSFVGGVENVYWIKTDSLGNSGCNETNPATIVTTPATIVTSPTTVTTSPATVVTSPATIVGSGGIVNTLCISTGIQSEIKNQKSEINFSPNPTSSNQTSHLTLTYPPLTTPSQIIINNIDGKEEGRYNLPQWSTTQKIKLPPLAAGIYVARLVNEQGRVGDVKFVVQ